MNKKEAKIEAYRIASVVVRELDGSDVTDSQKIKGEIRKIALFLSEKANEIENNK